jgi:dTMP kinase
MLRTLIAALYLISIPGSTVWAQVVRTVRVPAPLSSSMVSLPALAAPLAAPSLSAISLGAPSLSAASSFAAAAPVAAPLAAVAPALAAVPALAAASVDAQPSSIASARSAASAISEIAAHPGASESDAARVDFADGLRATASRTLSVLAAAPGRWLSGLAPRRTQSAPAGAAEIPVPIPAAPKGPRLAGYLSGTFGAQLASNSLQVTMPLLFLKMTGSVATAAFAVTIGSAFDAAGTLVGGWLTDRVHAKPVLIGTTIVRGLALAVLPVLALSGALTLPALAAVYAVECFSRGIADTARSTLPSELSGRDDGLLKKILAKNQTFFEAGGVAGPFIAGALMLGLGGVTSAAALWLAPAVFAAVTLAYLAIPRIAALPAAPAPVPGSPDAPKKKLDGWMRWALAATALLTMYPLKGLLPAIFATQILHNPASAAWLVGLFGVGGFLGSIAYGRWNKSVASKRWLIAGGIGALALAGAFLPGIFLPAALGVLAYSATNVAARLALNADIQSRAAPGQAGSAMGASRFTANLTGLGVRFLAGLAFTAAVAPKMSFWFVGGGVALVGLLHWLAAARLAALAAAGAVAFVPMTGILAPVRTAGPRPSAVHGMPGRLIVVEGLDGSGKSTQMERLKKELEAQGLKVVTTSWNSSDVVSDAVKKAKKAQALTPQTFALMNASDLADRLDKVILPALREGTVVLADRWFFTALARDRVRGMNAQWLRGLYAFAPKPDLVMYFRLPVKTAIGRVLSRSEGKLGLSEDLGEDDEAAKRLNAERHGLKYYEAGLDAKLSKDPVKNFELFQTAVTAEYDKQAKEFGFKIVDSARGRDEIHDDVTKIAFGSLGDLSAYKRAGEPLAKTNLFDKDPAGDAENIRRNYLHEKRGAHFYFRNMLLPMQDRFAQLMDMASMPKAFLHGSPHMDNYAKSAQGAAMVDFDRSRVGPYAWDLVRLMVSMSLRQKKDAAGLLDPDVLKQIKKGYLRGFRHPDRPFSEVRQLKDEEPEKDEASTDAYLKANNKWAKEMRANALPTNDSNIVKLIDGYSKTQEPGFLDDYFIEEAGRGQGSMGFRGLYLVVLAPKKKKSGKDRILLNIKATRTDRDTEWYKNPYKTEIERMHAAADLYAPGWALRAGSAVLDGVEFDVRQISPQNVKIKKMLNHEQQLDFAYAVGTQLGRAHRLSLQGSTPAQLEAHLDAHYDEIVASGLTIRDEIVDAHARYLRNMKKRGLEPHGEGDDE